MTFTSLTLVSCGAQDETRGNQSKSDRGFVYYVGDQWSKRHVDLKNPQESDLVLKVLRNIISIKKGHNIATGIYIGFLAGQGHLVATNNHIIPTQESCEQNSHVEFNFIYPKERSFKCSQLIETFPNIDLSIVSLDIGQTKADFFQDKKGFQFSKDFQFSQDHQFITAGFGLHRNHHQALKIDDSAECRLLSEPGETRQLRSNGQGISEKKMVWSMAIACDISIGDSGSPVIDVVTGKLAGMVWSGVYPKFKENMDIEVLDKLREKDPSMVWQNYNYAVPSNKIEDTFKLEEGNNLNFNLPKMLERTKLYDHLFK